jgi:uroporphyrinogen-III decarboxylase
MMKPAENLPPLNNLINSLPFQTLATPEFADMLDNLVHTARTAVQWQKETVSLVEELTELGFFCRQPPVLIGAPFDAISDFLRGMRGAMLDMYRRPEHLLQAIEKVCKMQLDRIAQLPRTVKFTPMFIALHRGAHGFMNLKQFEKFYWPYLMKTIEALVEAGYTPDLFFEGDYNSRLEFLTEMPKGKVIARFDQIDMARAKKLLGGKICIAGNISVSALQLGTTEDVKRICKELIDVAGKDGGYILSPSSSLDEVTPENLKVMVDFTKEYGRYR